MSGVLNNYAKLKKKCQILNIHLKDQEIINKYTVNKESRAET